MTASDQPLTSGVRDPDDPGRWLVCPWPTTASFCDVVHHFLIAYVNRLHADSSAARQLAYFRSYEAALRSAPTHELTYAVDWQWRDELLACVARCVALHQEKPSAERPPATGKAGQLRFNAPATIPAPARRDQPS